MGVIDAEGTVAETTTSDGRVRPSDVLTRMSDDLPETKEDRLTTIFFGLHKSHLVHLLGALAHPDWEARRLLDMADEWVKRAAEHEAQVRRR